MHIVHSMIRDIQRGRLAPGALLPSSRELAVSVGVNRKTIVLVYEELKAPGWIEATSTRGTRVAAALPEQLPDQLVERSGPDQHPDFEFLCADIRLSVTPHRATLTLALGSPHCRLFPAAVPGRPSPDAD